MQVTFFILAGSEIIGATNDPNEAYYWRCMGYRVEIADIY